MPHLYVHGDRDMLAMDESKVLTIWGSTDGSRISFAILTFGPVSLPNFTETRRPFLEASSSVARLSIKKALSN